MHQPGNILSLRFDAPAVAHTSRTPAQLTFCYQCHSAVDLGATTTALRSGHWGPDRHLRPLRDDDHPDPQGELG